MSFYGSSGYMFFSSTRTTSRRSSSMDSWFHSSTGTDLYSIDSYRIERGSEPISPVDEGKSHGKEVSKSSFKVFGNEFNCWPKWRPKSCISIYAIFRSGFEGGWAWSKRKKPLRWLIEFPSRIEWGESYQKESQWANDDEPLKAGPRQGMREQGRSHLDCIQKASSDSSDQ